MPIQSIKSGTLSRSTAVGNAIILPGDFESIATTVVGAGGQATITFSSIPSTFTNLQIRSLCRDTGSYARFNLRIRMNSDTANNYSYHFLQGGDGNITSAGSATSVGYANIGSSSGGTSSSGIFGVAVVDILDYANTNKYKTVRCLSGHDANGSGSTWFSSGLWMSTSAITSVSFTSDNGNFAEYSYFALYGIRG